MPPKGRTPNPPPRRRPRVAGLHQPGRATPSGQHPGPATDDGVLSERWADEPTPSPASTADRAADTDTTLEDHPVGAAAPSQAPAPEVPDDATTDTETDTETTPAAGPGMATPERPTTAGAAPNSGAVDGRRLSGVLLIVVLLLVTVVGGAAAIVFRGQAARASTGSADNLALVDTAATGEVVGQVSKAVETVLSYDYTKLDDNERAGREVITGRYEQEFGTTFADVRRTAPEQKLVLTTTVLLAGVTMLGEDRAEVIATMDLAAVRDTTPYNSPGRVKVVATKVDGRWKIAEMTLL